MYPVCRPGGRLVLVDLVPPTPASETPSTRSTASLIPHTSGATWPRSFRTCSLVEEDGLTYASAFSIRLPVSVAMTEQSDAEAVEGLLRDELDGGPSTGMLPLVEDDALTVGLHHVHPPRHSPVARTLDRPA